MKKLISSVLALTLLIAMSLSVFAETPKLFEGANEIITGEYFQTNTELYSTYSLNSKNTIIHNNGNAMESDYFVSGKEEGNNLIAVKLENTDYGVVETAYFANIESVNASDLVEIVSKDNHNINVLSETTKVRSAEEPIIKSYHWSFYYDNTILEATLMSNVYLTRQTANATLNGVACSVWDVTTFTQLEKEHCVGLNNQYTRLSVDVGHQTLLSYGPVGSASGGDVTVGLDGAGIFTPSYTFNIDGFSVRDLSSLSNNYGRWAFINYIGNEPSFTTQPGIRATNANGSFIVELSHTAEVTSNPSDVTDHQTGVIQIYCEDRDYM